VTGVRTRGPLPQWLCNRIYRFSSSINGIEETESGFYSFLISSDEDVDKFKDAEDELSKILGDMQYIRE
jgi:cell fate (sporulation/competence/biofilm development) regulator YlbF (YheA/YmcA/DUF963 family)